MPTDRTNLAAIQEEAIRQHMDSVRESIEQALSRALINTKKSDNTVPIALAIIDNNMRLMQAQGEINDYQIRPMGSDPNTIEFDVRLTRSIRTVKFTMSINGTGPGAGPAPEPITKMQFIVGEP